MPLPSVNDLHVDSVRTDMSVAYMNDREFLAADAICPAVVVDKQSDKFAVWSQADFMRIQVQEVADGSPAPELSFGVSTSTYFCKTYSGKKLITDRQRANARNEFELDKAAVAFLEHQMLLKRESVVATNLWGTGIWGTDSTPGTKWSASSSDPYGDIEVGMDAVHLAIGKYPTDFVMGVDVWNELKHHPDTIDRVKYMGTNSDPARVTLAGMAAVIGVKRCTVAGAVYNSASAGATATMAQLYDTNDALLIYRPDSPSQLEPSGAYTFSWAEFDEAKDGAAAIHSWRNDDPAGEYLRGMMSFDPKVTASGAGYYFNEATS